MQKVRITKYNLKTKEMKCYKYKQKSLEFQCFWKKRPKKWIKTDYQVKKIIIVKIKKIIQQK